MVRTQHFQCRDPGSIPGQGTKIPHVLGFPGGGTGNELTCQCRRRK